MNQHTKAQDPPTSPAAPPSVSNLAAKVAHELNNPLDAVLRFVSLAQRKAKTGNYSDIDRYLADAQFGLQRMAEVLRELMDLGRQTNDILASAAPATLPLIDLVSRATRTAAAQAEQKHISLILKSLLPEGLNPTYDLRVAQILSNLLKNAIEAAPENTPVRVTVSLISATNQTTEDTENGSHTSNPSSSVSSVVQNVLAIHIEDSGPGIPEHLLPQLFTPFLTTKPTGSGHGLGLAISRELALSLHGALTLANRTPNGCLATLTLPITNY